MGNHETEPTDHAQMRTLLTPFFSTKRIAALRPRVEAMVDQFLNVLATRTPPVDLHEALSFLLPAMVTCELPGVPFADRELNAYIRELVERKRAQPEKDILSGLCAREYGSLSTEHIAEMGAGPLFARHETTVVRIDTSALLFMTHPDQRQALLSRPRTDHQCCRGDPAPLQRYPTLHPGSHQNWRCDHPARRGSTTKRQPNPHLAFGYGSHFCIGAPLARIELQTVLARLLPCFPTLRLAISPENIRLHNHMLKGA